MKNRITFGKVFWPSLIAGLLICIIGAVVFTGIIGSWMSSFDDFSETGKLQPKVNSVLHMRLEGEIAERSSSKFNPASLSMESKIGVADILLGLELAAKDSKIKGVFIELDGISCGYASIKEIRKAIDKFEKSGKFAMAYIGGEVVTLKEFYLSSAANKIYGFPTSTMEFLGLGAELTFFKNSMRKLDIEAEVIRGKNNDFKSAVEPFFRDRMSDSSEHQLKTLLNNSWTEIKNDIAKARQVKGDDLDTYANEFSIRRAEDAARLNLIDGVKYRDEVLAELAKKSGNKVKDEKFLISFEKYTKQEVYQDQLLTKNNKPNIAVILAEGGISVDGDEMTSKDICALLKKARNNPSIKTVVLRVNSPGGSALASDEIWREVKLTDEKKKVIVSMGDVAASGGYYISAPATAIFAEPNTITGSIGVFGVLPYTGKMFERKLGFTFDRVSTHDHQVLSTNRKLTKEELKIIQEEVDKIYDEFLGRVAEGRGMSKDEVNVIARGRVWSGIDAKQIGLVDELGGLQEAIAYAAKHAGIKSDMKKVLYYPIKKKDKWEDLLTALDQQNEGSDTQVKAQAIPALITEQLNKIQYLQSLTGYQMRMPFEMVIK
jgi:protease-4